MYRCCPLDQAPAGLADMIRSPTFRSFFNLPWRPWQAGVALPKGVVSCSAGSTTFEQLGGASKPGALAAVSGFRQCLPRPGSRGAGVVESSNCPAKLTRELRTSAGVQLHADPRNLEEGIRARCPLPQKKPGRCRKAFGSWDLEHLAGLCSGSKKACRHAKLHAAVLFGKMTFVHGSVVLLIPIHAARGQHYDL